MPAENAQPASNNIVVGAGYIYTALQNSDGTFELERYFGDTPGFTIATASSGVQVFGSDGPIATKLRDITTQLDRTATIRTRNISRENIALHMQGDFETISQSSGSVSDERHTAKTDRWIQLGVSDTDPVGVRSVSNVTITIDPDGAAGTTTEDTDFEVDEELGRVYILPGAGISDDDVLGIAYDTAAKDIEQITSSNLEAKKGRVRFVAANTEGNNRDVVIPLSTIRPEGEIAWKAGPDRSTVAEMTFSLGIETFGTLKQVYVNGRPA